MTVSGWGLGWSCRNDTWQGCCMWGLLEKGVLKVKGSISNRTVDTGNVIIILYLAVQKYSIQTRAIISIDLVVPVFQISTTAWLSQWKRELLWVSGGVSRYWLLQWYQKFFHTIAISFSSSGDQWACIHLPHQYTFYLTVTKLTASIYSDMKVEVFLRYRRCHFRMEGRSAIVLCQHELVCLIWCDDVA